MAQASDSHTDRYAAQRAKHRSHLAGQMLRLASNQLVRLILDYGLDHPGFHLAKIAKNLALDSSKLYPTTGRMLRLGMVCKLHPGHKAVIYELTPHGKLIAETIRQLTRESTRVFPVEDE